MTSDRSRAENRLGQKLVAPAIILMLLVTAFPMLRAIWLSVFDYSLTAPDDREFIGLSNYVTALTDPLFWQTTGITVLLHGGHGGGRAGDRLRVRHGDAPGDLRPRASSGPRS